MTETGLFFYNTFTYAADPAFLTRPGFRYRRRASRLVLPSATSWTQLDEGKGNFHSPVTLSERIDTATLRAGRRHRHRE